MEWAEEVAKITTVALAHGTDPELIKAIRKHENGKPGGKWGEFGLPWTKYPSYEEQLNGCVKTVRGIVARYNRNPFALGVVQGPKPYRRLVYSITFLTFLRDIYAPIGVENDPQGLNRNWLPGVVHFYGELNGTGGAVA